MKKVAVLDEDELRELLDRSQGRSLVSLAELVIEGLSADVRSLAKKIGGDRVVLDDVGRRCCTRDVARELFEEKAAGDRRAAEMNARNAARRTPNPYRQRVEAIQKQGLQELVIESPDWRS
ncbi:hypothetical protein [Mycobacteroides chelonae]|uniref:hypothetical protein n=1 Tax=Mycobacteroides chelonae TaxID=1774 RepID=UPI0008A9675E|nr:hypothetical protein [Mycobacteroides chelonae]OHU48901.1 hypothetical protein BKG81_15975 [Mycobacteroides chelonae]